MLAAAIRDNVRHGNDGMTNRQRRYHARQWARGAGRRPTRAEMACLRELAYDPADRPIVTLPPVP